MPAKSKSLKQYARGDAREYKSGELPDLNWRSTEGRRFMRMVSQLVQDAGGADRVSALRLQLLRRVSAAIVLIEQIEAEALAGKPYDFLRYGVLLGAIAKIARIVGIERIPRDVQSLDDYLTSLQKGGSANGADAAVEEGVLDLAGCIREDAT
jgi:hypothetical protein